jgi:hypothetical protein
VKTLRFCVLHRDVSAPTSVGSDGVFWWGTLMSDSAIKSEDTFSQRDKIQIILEEYKMLRTEIQSRNGYGFQIPVLALGALSWIASKADFSSWPAYISVVSIIIVGLWMWRINVRDIWRAAERTCEIECDINRRTGERLMVWEQRFGPARVPYLISLLSKVTPLPEVALPTEDRQCSPATERRLPGD